VVTLRAGAVNRWAGTDFVVSVEQMILLVVVVGAVDSGDDPSSCR
jgi:hypothetical protein